MAPKIFFKTLENFKGLDTDKGILSRSPEFAEEFQNFRVVNNRSARGRPGHYLIDSSYMPGAFGGALGDVGPYGRLLSFRRELPSRFGWSSTVPNHTIAMGLYNFSRLERGATKIVRAVGQEFHFYLEDVGAGVYHYFADCRVAGVSVGGVFPLDCGTGLEEIGAGLVTLADLKNAIDALGGGWSMEIYPYAVVDGDQAGRDHANPVAVVAASNWLSSGHYVTLWTPHLNVKGQPVAIIATAAASVTIKDPHDPTRTIDVLDGQIFGIGNLPAATLPLNDNSTIGWITDYPNYWAPLITHGISAAITRDFGTEQTLQGGQEVLRQNAYFATETDIVTDVFNGSIQSGLWKYDGRQVYAAGMPQCGMPALSLPGAGGALSVGRYRYLCEYVFTDYDGNEIHGNASDLLGEAEITTVGANLQVRVQPPSRQQADANVNAFPLRAAVVSANYGPGRTIPVTAATNHIVAGDTIYFENATGVIEWRDVTSVTATTVVTNALQDPVTVLAGAILGMVRIRIWRTTVGGTFFYFCKEVLNDPFNAVTTYVDGLADTALEEQWEGPFLGRDRRDIPPVGRLLTTHQGLLVCAKDFIFNWSNYESAEYWSRSTNFQELLPSGKGSLSALISDQGDNLILFLPRSYWVVSGDLYWGNYSLISEASGDVGCPNANGCVKVRESIFFISHKGPRVMQAGSIIDFDNRMSKYFINSSGNAPVYNHVKEQKIFCAISSGLQLVFDYKDGIWATYSLPPAFGAGMGMVYDATDYGEETAVLSLSIVGGRTVISTGFVNSDDSPHKSRFQYVNYDMKYLYADGHVPISYLFRPQWDFSGDEMVNKVFQKIILWILGNDPCVPTDLTVKTFRNFSNAVADTSVVVPVVNANVVDYEIPLTLNRAKALQVSFECNKLYQCPHITGYEVEISTPFKKEHVSLKDS